MLHLLQQDPVLVCYAMLMRYFQFLAPGKNEKIKPLKNKII